MRTLVSRYTLFKGRLEVGFFVTLTSSHISYKAIKMKILEGALSQSWLLGGPFDF